MEPELNSEVLKSKYKPLSTLAYFGYISLFCIPIVNIIAIIILIFSSENVNTKNLAKGYLIHFVFSTILTLILVGILALLVNLGAIVFDKVIDVADVTKDIISTTGDTANDSANDNGIPSIITGLEIFNSANTLTDDAVSQIDALTIQMVNSNLTQYEGNSVRGSAVNALLDTIKNYNEEDMLPKDIAVNGESNIDSTKKYKVSFDYDSETGYINEVTIAEAE